MTDARERGLRLDIWLWRARLFKTRSAARNVASSGRVRVTRPGRGTAPAKPSFGVLPGDVITLRINGVTQCLQVESCGERRGPPAEARSLYRPVDTEALSETRPAAGAA